MPANERMDTLVEKATELGARRIVPLLCERSVLRLQGERAVKKQAHWRGVAIAAAEQSGRTRLPAVDAVAALPAWLRGLPAHDGPARWLLSLGARRWRAAATLGGTQPDPAQRTGRRAEPWRAGPGAGRWASSPSVWARACCAPTPRPWPRWPAWAYRPWRIAAHRCSARVLTARYA